MLTVSNYHYIRESFKADYPSIFGVTPAEFERQLKLLKNEGDFISPNLLVSDIANVLKTKENLLFITFDDGLKEQFDLALPILDELQIPAVFFANSLNAQEKKVTVVHKIHLLRSVLSPAILMDKIIQVHPIRLSNSEQLRARDIYRFDESQSAELKFLLNFKIPYDQQQLIVNRIFIDFFDETEVFSNLYMDEQQLTCLATNGYLGSHTHTHLPLGLLSENEMLFELNHSKSYFEKLTNSAINIVSYPYGTAESATDKVAETAHETGYKLGFTTHKGVNVQGQNPLLLNRFDCNDLVGGKNNKK